MRENLCVFWLAQRKAELLPLMGFGTRRASDQNGPDPLYSGGLDTREGERRKGIQEVMTQGLKGAADLPGQPPY
jgi:hypothetical protein